MTEEYRVYRAVCKDCKWKTGYTQAEHVPEGQAEEHMMQTGHIVEVRIYLNE